MARQSTTRETLQVTLKRLRAARDLRQEDLAARAGVPRSYLARLETGIHDPKLSTLERLAKALKVSVASLISGRAR